MRLHRAQFTVGHMMGLIVYAAVACACAVPILRLRQLGIVGVPFLATLAPPVIALGWAATSMVLIRRGRLRTRLVTALVLLPVAFGLVAILRAMWPLAGAALRGRRLPPNVRWGIALMATACTALLGLFIVLARSLVRPARRGRIA